jgi:hypothetical protein
VTEAELVRSAARARDVVESYRQYDLTVSRWQTRLLTSSASIARIAAERPELADGRPELADGRPDAAGVRLADLAEALRDVARNGLRPERARLDQLSKDLESLVRERVPGYPRPEDPPYAAVAPRAADPARPADPARAARAEDGQRRPGTVLA